jgi:electron transfer flavoprotein alpha subunit
MATLVVADIVDGALSDLTAKTLTAALRLGDHVDLFIASDGAQHAIEQAALLTGVHKVIHAQHDNFAHDLAEPITAVIVQLAAAYDAILASSSTAAKNIMPRVAALLDVMQISDITEVIDATTFVRPIYAGNAIQTVQSRDSKRVITVRTTAFAASPNGTIAAPIEAINVADMPLRAHFISQQQAKNDRPSLTSAKVIISGGRALQSADNFHHLIEPLADRLGAAIGASRAAVDAGYAPNDWQVGQTGKIVAPELYIAVGISGAIQHLAGMKDSKIIVAINKDEEAPIFQCADYGLVADLFEALPALTKELG